jgi:DNA-binding LacI/PurR family transcriptional regulator
MTTIIDVAKRAGVSVSTVSYALNGTRPISEATRQRIQKAVDELGYHPNKLARGLVSKRTKIVSLMYPALSRNLDDVQLDFVAGAAAAATKFGYSILLWTSPYEDKEIVRFINESMLDGLILMEVRLHDTRVELLHKMNFPFSMIGHCAKNDGLIFVDSDFTELLKQAVQHLAQLGHQNIAFISYPKRASEGGYGYVQRAHFGFTTEIEKLGLMGIIQDCEISPEAGYEATLSLLKENPLVTSLIVTNESVYSGAIRAIHSLGLRIPEDISTIANISSRLAHRYSPSITTMDMPAYEMGHLGVEMLIKRLEGKEDLPMQVLIPAEIHIRQTTGPCKQSNPE